MASYPQRLLLPGGEEPASSDNLNACITDAIGRLVWQAVPSAETIVYAIEFSQREFAGTRR